ncbi:MAG TPA: L-2-hydroxyglutarate oxidase [Gaiellaceae bacterium]|nr:L-2-hydroxyglutarate oxidase [Gaiellaceae bacterium]
MSGKYDIAVVGAGLIGLATARALLVAHPHLQLVVFEKEAEVARHQSGHNSGVIHSGLYYPAGSLKAQLCREGREELLRFAAEKGIPHLILGKLVVAVDDSELPRLEELRRRGEANGLVGMRELEDWSEIEPHVRGVRALHVPETGSIDYRVVARAYAEDVRERGGELVLGHEVRSPQELPAERVVVCGGLQADRLAGRTEPRIVPFRGDYYVLSSRAAQLVRGHVYPVPDPTFPFLGVHFSRRIDGAVWAGPNAVLSLAREGYGRMRIDVRDATDVLRRPAAWRLARRYWRTGARELWADLVKPAALREMRRYLPALRSRDVRLGPSGIRAQLLAADGSLVDDFLLEQEGSVLHVLNAPSPAATASLAIGRRIAAQLA